MVRISQYLAIMVLVLSVVSIVIGATFIYQAIDKKTWMEEAMRAGASMTPPILSI